MLRATSVVRKAAVKADKITGEVVLAHEDRQRRRVMLAMADGREFLLDLDKATDLNDGDALKLEVGGLVLVNAAVQELLEIRAENPLRLMRVAWHIGNRHTPAEITDGALYIEDDHVLAEMIRGQGCSLAKVMRPFKPERGAYDHAGHDHASDDHAHDHARHLDHGHGEAPHAHADHANPARDNPAHANPAHANPAHGEPGHVHGPGCGHDHHHGHTHDVLNVSGHEHAHDHNHHGQDRVHKDEHAHSHSHDHGHPARHKHDH